MSHPLVEYVEAISAVDKPKKLDHGLLDLAREMSVEDLRGLVFDITWRQSDLTEALRALLGAMDMRRTLDGGK